MEEHFNCPCPRANCSRHGKCDECRAYHTTQKKHPPFCERQKLKEEKKKERALKRAAK